MLNAQRHIMNNSKLALWLQELRAPFFTASIIPVLVGTALAYSATNIFNPALFILAILGMVALHAGANIANDYFDHTSGNDWANKNVTPFSGGSQLIQQGLLSPKSVLIASLIALSIAALIGIMILAITKSVFILALGIAGLIGGYFYTASPLRLGYRGAGELIIGLLFGVLPVYGSYYLQTAAIDPAPLLPGIIVAMLIFLVILMNEFPDAPADSAVNKRTLVVIFGDKTAVWIYTVVLIATFCIALAAILIFKNIVMLPFLLYLLTIPLAVIILKTIKKEVLQKTSGYKSNQLTILLHLAGGCLLAVGFLISGLMN
jgi:1,4-dihydroxy-2-naphthoate octaprenyltransferase